MIAATVLADAPHACFPGCLTCAFDIVDGESVDAWKARIRATLRQQMGRRKNAVTGNKPGPPRGDAAVLAVLVTDEWRSAERVAGLLNKTTVAAYGALHRAQQRGHVEHRRNAGYRRIA